MNKTKTYYQPQLCSDDGTNIEWSTPIELASFHAFASEEDCKAFMKKICGYADNEYVIQEYNDDDIEGVTILDAEGDVIETNE